MPVNKLKECNVLIVDDNFTDRLKLFTFLKHYKVRKIQEAEDGGIALFKIDNALSVRQPFHLVFLDMNMPRANGLQLLKRLKEEKEHNTIYVILMSNLLNEEKVEIAIDRGVDDILVKPYTRGQLEEKLKKAVLSLGFTLSEFNIEHSLNS